MAAEADEQLREAECLAMYDEDGELIGYLGREWHYGTCPDGRWWLWRNARIRRGEHNKRRDISDWELVIELLGQHTGWRLVPVSEDEAMARVKEADGGRID